MNTPDDIRDVAPNEAPREILNANNEVLRALLALLLAANTDKAAQIAALDARVTALEHPAP